MEEVKLNEVPKVLEINGNKFHHAVGIAWEHFDDIVQEQGHYGGFIIFVDDELAERLLKKEEGIE